MRSEHEGEWIIERDPNPQPRLSIGKPQVPDMTHRQFFGDAERDFRLDAPQVEELERITGVGIGSLCQRLFKAHFAQAEIVQTIRLALIGGGTSPHEADALTKAYAVNRPLAETYPLALAILEARYFGTAAKNETVSDSEAA